MFFLKLYVYIIYIHTYTHIYIYKFFSGSAATSILKSPLCKDLILGLFMAGVAHIIESLNHTQKCGKNCVCIYYLYNYIYIDILS
jgi:hypothetical protein